MVKVVARNAGMSVTAHQGDAKTLLAFDLGDPAGLAGFTVEVTPPGKAPYYLLNTLRFERPGDHAQDPTEPAVSSINAPIHKFRWLHVPGSAHQGLDPAFGRYTYAVTPRHFDGHGRMTPLDPGLTLPVEIEVAPFAKGRLAVGFTRGFTQSQAFVRHFGHDALIRPRDGALLFDTSAVSGQDAQGRTYTYAQQYAWLGYTARDHIFGILREVLATPSLRLDVFAYDLNEPDLIDLLLRLAHEKRVRVILDNASLHHDKAKPKPEDAFEALFAAAAGPCAIRRGHLGRYAHDKVFVVYDIVDGGDGNPRKVLTGSTNFSVTGLYVNSNHVLVFDDRAVAARYAAVFREVWGEHAKGTSFKDSDLATQAFRVPAGASLPEAEITFAPHTEAVARDILAGLVDRVRREEEAPDGRGSVLFAVMLLDGAGADNPVYDALNALHRSRTVFSFGISDTPAGIALYKVGSAEGVLVTGKPVDTQLPPPFDQVPGVGLGHQVHHKFVVCGFNGPDPVVYCGSSNLALLGEQVNGDNLLAIRDGDVATVFAIEALGLVDHFNFLDGAARRGDKAAATRPAADKQQAATAAGLFLGTDDRWAAKFFDPGDLHCRDRLLFAG